MWNLSTKAPAGSPRTKTFTPQPNSTQYSTETIQDFKTLYLAIVLLMNILGNSGVIATIIRDLELRTSPRNIVLASLALSDIFMAFVIAFRIWIIYYEQTAPTTCVVFTTLFSVFLYVSVLHLFTVSLDSYIAVFYPLSYRTILTRRRLAIAITTVWVLPSSILATLSLFLKERNELHVQNIFPYCLGLQDISVDESYKTLTYAEVSVFFIIPVVCMMAVYLKIAKVSWYQANRVGPMGSAVRAGRLRAREMKWVKTIGIVIGTFTICYLPIIVMLLCQASNGSESSLSVAIQFIAFTNTAINPLVYSLRSREYRKALLKLVKSTNIKSSVLNALPIFGASSSNLTTSSTQSRSGRRRSSLRIESSGMASNSTAFTIYFSQDRTSTLENILSELIKSTEDTEEPRRYSEPHVAEETEMNTSVPRQVLPVENRDCSSCTLEPNVRII